MRRISSFAVLFFLFFILLIGPTYTVASNQDIANIKATLNASTNILLLEDKEPVNVIFVNSDDSIVYRDGRSWATAYATVQVGIDSFCKWQPAEEDCCSVWIARGTSPTEVGGTIQLRSSVSLYGGFAGHESELDGRDVEVNQTILSGYSSDGRTRSKIMEAVSVENVLIDGLLFRDGHAHYDSYDAPINKGNGGALFIDNSQISITHSQFRDNNSSGWPYRNGEGYGAAIYSTGDESTLIIDHSLFENNSAGGSGGAICMYVGELKIDNSDFRNNNARAPGGPDSEPEDPAAGTGGAIRMASTSFMFNNLRFIANSSGSFFGGSGGAIRGGSGRIINSIFYRNSTDWYGGAISNSGSIEIVNSTFLQNSAFSGPAISVGSATIINSIVWNHWPYFLEDPAMTGSVSARNNIIGNGYDHDFPGENNINQDPLFVDSRNGDLRLQAGSPCIDRAIEGAPETDIEGTARVDGNGDGTIQADLGAYEYSPQLVIGNKRNAL